ncbi:MAG: hypothetical protein LBG04_01230 [Holosporaceae bacterium]|nr:hypothetical protein [Holosporaceae bacterium]
MPPLPITANAGAVQAPCGSSEISEQMGATCILKNSSVSAGNVQVHVFALENGKRRNVDDQFAISGIGDRIEEGNTYELSVRLIDADGLHKNQRVIVVITAGGDRIIEFPLQLSSNDK